MKNRIGEVAGEVWRLLDKRGPMHFKMITRQMNGIDQSLILMAIGWLAREDKVEITGEQGSMIVALHRVAQTV